MWLIITLTAFPVFLGSLYAFVWRGCRPDGKLRPSARYYALAAAISLVLWVYALPRVPPPYPLDRLKHYVPPPLN